MERGRGVKAKEGVGQGEGGEGTGGEGGKGTEGEGGKGGELSAV